MARKSRLKELESKGVLQMVIMTEKDYVCLEEKLNNPGKEVRCVRCGNEIVYEKRGNSVAVECKTLGCIYGGIRGV